MTSAPGTEGLLEKLLSEQSRSSRPTYDVTKDDCKTVRIFISSTFKDFYNEREYLVTLFFAALLSPVLDGFDQLLSFIVLSLLPINPVTSRQGRKISLEKILETPRYEPRTAGLRSLNATATSFTSNHVWSRLCLST